MCGYESWSEFMVRSANERAAKIVLGLCPDAPELEKKLATEIARAVVLAKLAKEAE